MVVVSIVGASGYVGGELLRLLLEHPGAEVSQVTSESRAGKFVHSVHPNLRGRTTLKFVAAGELTACDLLFVALPHGAAAGRIEELAALAPRVIDLSADFRLNSAERYEQWYGHPHPCPDWLPRFAYGLPEVNRSAIRAASLVSGVGCNATATNLALWPLVRAELIDTARAIVVDLKVGSSEGGNRPGLASHHPERSGSVRSFAPTGHRHTAEVEETLGLDNVHLSVTSIEMVRGVLATAHVWLQDGVGDKQIWQAYRSAFSDEPFLRIVKDRSSIYRHPEPKILAGSNFADVGFEVDARTGRCVSLCALDNLMKGAAGTAVQSMNVMLGLEETAGLDFPGLHPV